METTKSWITPKRLARGPEAADAELRRWAKTAFRPARVYGSIQAMRADALASQQAGKGSSRLANASHGIKTHEAVALVAITGAAFIAGRWIGKRWKTKKHTNEVTQHQQQAQQYLHGTDILGSV